MPPTDGSLLARMYRRHHAEGDRCGCTVMGDARAELFRSWIGTAVKDVLDLGCRDGTLTHRLAAHHRVIGADIDRGALVLCTQRHPFPVLQANLNAGLPFPADRFDVVVLAEVLEHLPYLAITLPEIQRILRPEGELIGSVPLDLSLRGRWRIFRGKRICHDPTHLQHWSQTTFEEDMSEYFDLIDIRPLKGFTRIPGLQKSVSRRVAFRVRNRTA